MRASLVIPAYNAEGVLGQCLGSLLLQEGADIEVVVVDDGSRDGTYALAEQVARTDARVKVVRKANGGVSSARNAGLEAATGDVVLFVDADDALVPGALAYVCAQMAEGDADCLVFGMLIEPEDAMPLTLSHRLAPRDAVIEDDPRRLIFSEHTHPYAFRTAFSREFLTRNGLRFDETLTLGEDEAFLMCAYRLVHRALLSSRQLYVYRMSDTSASHRDNASDEVLPTKLGKHRALVSSVMGEWKARGFDASCDRELLDWALDLLMLDVSRLPEEGQVGFYATLWPVLTSYFGPTGGRDVASLPARRCLAAIRRAAGGGAGRGSAVPRRLLVWFYLHSRGLAAVFERALASMCGKGAY